MAGKARWGDEVSEALGDELPPPSVVGPDKNGIKAVTSYVLDEDGKKWKIVRKIKVKKVTQVVNHDVARRKNLKKFGNAANHGPGPNPSTTNVGEEVIVKLSFKAAGALEGEEEAQAGLADLKKKKDKILTCRTCKGDHFTHSCPYKDTLGVLNEQTQAEQVPVEKIDDSKKIIGKYVPPSLRGNPGEIKKRGDSMGETRDKDFASLRVSNLSEETHDTDLRELFRRFGPVHRIFLAKDKNTNVSKGYAYVSYYNVQDAENAIKHLNGYGYDNLILQVEWSARQN